jgi:hypothetical protein
MTEIQTIFCLLVKSAGGKRTNSVAPYGKGWI